MSASARRPAHVYAIYTDEPIGMDHPLFMARTQARLWAAIQAQSGEPIMDAVPGILKAIRELFGLDTPGAMVTAEVSVVYAEQAANGEVQP